MIGQSVYPVLKYFFRLQRFVSHLQFLQAENIKDAAFTPGHNPIKLLK